MTGVMSADELVEVLGDTSILRADQKAQLAQIAADFGNDATRIIEQLVHFSWITPYQASVLLGGHGRDLVLGNYVVLDEIGEGGMGKVYKAKQLRLSRVVALKVIRSDLLNDELAVRRFRREAKSAAQLT